MNTMTIDCGGDSYRLLFEGSPNECGGATITERDWFIFKWHSWNKIHGQDRVILYFVVFQGLLKDDVVQENQVFIFSSMKVYMH